MKTLVVPGTVLIGCLFIIQFYWLHKAFNTADQQFDHSVSVALHTVADSISDNAIIRKAASNYYFVATNCPVSEKVIDSLVKKEFSARDFQLDYELGVYNAEDDSLIYGNFVKKTNTSILSDMPIDSRAETVNKNFVVYFPGKESHLIGKLNIWLFSTIVLFLMSGFFYYAISILKKSGHSIRSTIKKITLGNSVLDFHNQFLKVQDSTIKLTYKENKILQLLFENPNEVIERKTFLKTIWEDDGFFVARSMDVFISKLRKYLINDPTIHIENLRAIGYRLRVK